MLNLSSIFQDAIDVFSDYWSYLEIPALPASIFLMQQDVVNNYRHAASHYLPLNLDEHFLQNSSIGTPYEKWAKITNKEFQQLSFTVTNLIRYTVRLIEETEHSAMMAERRYQERHVRSDAYISPLIDINSRQCQIGIRVGADQSLFITPFSNEQRHYDVVDLEAEDNDKPIRYRALIDSDGKKHIITQAEYRELLLTLREKKIDIKNRSIIQKIAHDGIEECNNLEEMTARFAKLCNIYYKDKLVASKYESLFHGLGSGLTDLV